MSKSIWIQLLAFHGFLFVIVSGSIGDRSQYYHHCVLQCHSEYCNKEAPAGQIFLADLIFRRLFIILQSFMLIDLIFRRLFTILQSFINIDGSFKVKSSIFFSLVLWTCNEDCSYICIWETVEYFTTHGLKVPQFHGKWPFIRLLGCQEPASVIFSMLNFCVHWKMYQRLRKTVRGREPMFYIWSFFSMVCLTGWFWSTVFHARDTIFTEVMDYSCAFFIVVTLLYSMLLRITYKSTKAFILITCGYISILYMHLPHLWSGQINYGYNMKFNIVIGFLTFVITMIWWHRNRKKLPHVYLIGWFNILTVFVTLLEVADFPPLFWTFDAHSLWHATTAPLAVLLYRFMIFDCTYLNIYYGETILKIDHVQ